MPRVATADGVGILFALLLALALLLVLSRGSDEESAAPDVAGPRAPVAGPERRLDAAGTVESEAARARTVVTTGVEESQAARSLTLVVFDAGGRPMGDVPILVEPGDEAIELSSGSENGRLIIEGRLLRTLTSKQDPTVELAVALPFLETVGLEVTPADITGEPVDLRLPPMGSVRVEFDAPDGSMVCLWVEDVPSGTSWVGKNLHESLEDSVAVFPRVGLGLDLMLYGSVDDSFATCTRNVKGPTQEGEEVVVRLDRPETVPLVGRLLDEEGNVLADVAIRIGYQVPGVGRFRTSTTDDDGRFRVDFDPELAAAESCFLMLKWEEGKRREPDKSIREIPRTLPPEGHDYGDVVLGTGPILAEGRVVTGVGDPVSKGRLRIRSFSLLEGHWAQMDMKESMDFFGGRLDEDGRFRLIGVPRNGEWELTAHVLGCLPSETMRVREGQRDIELRVTRKARVWVSLDWPHDFPPNGIVVVAVPHEREGRKSTWRAASREDLTVSLGPLRPGRYDVRIQGHIAGDEYYVDSGSMTLLEIPGVLVEEGADLRPAALSDVDLASISRVVTTRVRTSWGEVPREVWCELQVKGDPLSGCQSHQADTAWIVPLAEHLELRVQAAGYKELQLDDPAADQDVILRGGIEVSLWVTGDFPLEGEGYRLVPVLRGPRISDESHVIGTWSEGRIIEAIVPAPGKYRVEWSLIIEGEYLRLSSRIRGGDGEVRVEEGKPGAVLELTLGEETQAEITERLARHGGTRESD